jgi:hypothetical protein
MEYELVKYILNNEMYDDDGNSIEELHQLISDHESDTRGLERELAHMAAVMSAQDYRLDKLNSELLCVKKELAICKEANND